MTTSTLDRPTADPAASARYARCIVASRRARWDIERDVIRGRELDFDQHFLPDGLSLSDQFDGLTPPQRRLMSQVQGRTYANMFGLVERFIGAKTLELGGRHSLGDQVAMEALVRMTDEELKHQALFRRLEQMMAAGMPPGYAFLPEPDGVAALVLSKGDWAVLGLTLHIELFTLSHYRASIADDPKLSALWRDVFRYHWMEESQHAVLDELEWRREHAQCDAAARELGVEQFTELVGAVDGVLQLQARADADYFAEQAGPLAVPAERLHDGLLRAYRWQYIVSGAQEPRFAQVLAELTTEPQRQRLQRALAAIVAQVGSPTAPSR